MMPFLKNKRCGESLEDEHLLNGGKEDASVGKVMSYFRLAGFSLGLLVQFVSLGAVTWIGMRWGETGANEVNASRSDAFLYVVLWVASHLALAVWPLVWMTPFVLSMTETGSRWVEPLFSAKPSQRSLFLTGVNFFVGISLGSFLAMSFVDAVFGFPVCMVKLAACLVVCLALCYIMVLCYDMEEQAAAQHQQETERSMAQKESGCSHYDLLLDPVVV